MTPLRFANAPNFRDLGGIVTRAGRRVRHGRIYRSGALNHLGSDEWERLDALGISLFCDLRSPAESARHAHGWPGKAPAMMPLAVLPDVRSTGDALLERVLSDPTGGQARGLLLENYAEMPRALAPQLRVLVDRILSEDGLPMLIACTAGQDRTGFVSALLLSALDVEHDVVVQDYMRSAPIHDAEKVRNFLAKSLGGTAVDPPSDEVVEALRADEAYLAAAFAVVDEEFGGVGEYWRRFGDLDPARRDLLASMLLEDVGA